MVFGLFLGLGSFSLRAMVLVSARGVVLGAGYLLGSVLGELALHLLLLRLGSVASCGLLCERAWFYFWGAARGLWI